jgi:rSAM/selenodomain-associated transferase 1
MPSGRPAILVMARTPELGRGKSRLARSVGQQAALRLQQAFLQDTLALARSAAHSLHGRIFLAYEGLGPPSESDLQGLPCFRQCRGDLGQRQSHAQDRLFRLGAGAVITIGTDSPDLPVDRLLSAWQDRSRADLILVPAADGGYILVSHTCPLPWLYDDIPWGTPGALAALQEKVAAGGKTVHQLEPWHDIDDQDDLQGLRQKLTVAPRSAPCSAQALLQLKLEAAS